MQADVTSKHLRGTAELMLIVPIKPGFVQSRELVSYATRLRRLLNALFEANRQVAEHDLHEGAGPIPRLQSIFTTQWAVLDDIHAPRLFVSACFDRPWEDYVELLVVKTGPLLDAIFCHCVGYENLTCKDGYEAFAVWLRSHQIPCDFFYAATPDLTIDDLRYQRKLGRALTKGDHPASVWIGSAEQEAELTGVAANGGAQRLGALIGDLFPDIREFPDRSERTARDILVEAIASFDASTPLPPPPKPALLERADLESIQGNVLRSYERMTHGCVLLIQCTGTSALLTLLGRLRDEIASEAERAERKPRLNVALTYRALERLNLGEDTLALFPKEFREGMEARSGLLGDVGAHYHPDFWQEPKLNWSKPEQSGDSGQRIRLSTVDVVLTVQGGFEYPAGTGYEWTHDHPLQPVVNALHLDSIPGVRILHVQPLRRVFEAKGYKEHFGFLDSGDGRSGSQPVPDVEIIGESLTKDAADRDKLPLGELLLGYEDRRSVRAACADYVHNPGSAALFRNGTFMVLRKLRQHVGRFEAFAENAAAALAESECDAERVKSLIVGRRIEDGEPLFRSKPAAGDPRSPNDFTFEGDEAGLACPLHSHIRRANPRAGEPLPRIVRRGFSYGAPYDTGTGDAADRGLLFMAYNTSIAEQFEVIQRWLNGGNSTGLPSAQNDLFTGIQPRAAQRWLHVAGKSRALAEPEAPFVTLSWGLYLFVPSKQAIDWLVSKDRIKRANLAGAGELVRLGASLIERLDALAEVDPEQAKQAWKRVLEQPESRLEAAAVWTAIATSAGQTKRTPYGLLVASAQGAETVLGDSGAKFSVREYWPRLRDTMGEHYLNFDRTPGELRCPHARPQDAAYENRLRQVSYELLSGAPNRFIETLAGDAYREALKYARDFLSGPAAQDAGNGLRQFDVRELATGVIGRLAQHWLGMPLPVDCSDAALASFVEHFVAISQYAFQPYPEAWLAADARARGQKLREAYSRGPVTGKMVDALRQRGVDEASVQQAVVGAIVGFAAPAIASVATTLAGFLRSGELWRLTQAFSQLHDKERLDALRKPVVASLQRAPIPPILYRTAVAEAELGGVTTRPGEFVIVGLQAAAVGAAQCHQGDGWTWLFGGEHGEAAGDGKPPHGCPARPAAVAAMIGTVAAVIELADLTALSPTGLAFRPRPAMPRRNA